MFSVLLKELFYLNQCVRAFNLAVPQSRIVSFLGIYLRFFKDDKIISVLSINRTVVLISFPVMSSYMCYLISTLDVNRCLIS